MNTNNQNKINFKQEQFHWTAYSRRIVQSGNVKPYLITLVFSKFFEFRNRLHPDKEVLFSDFNIETTIPDAIASLGIAKPYLDEKQYHQLIERRLKEFYDSVDLPTEEDELKLFVSNTIKDCEAFNARPSLTEDQYREIAKKEVRIACFLDDLSEDSDEFKARVLKSIKDCKARDAKNHRERIAQTLREICGPEELPEDEGEFNELVSRIIKSNKPINDYPTKKLWSSKITKKSKADIYTDARNVLENGFYPSVLRLLFGKNYHKFKAVQPFGIGVYDRPGKDKRKKRKAGDPESMTLSELIQEEHSKRNLEKHDNHPHVHILLLVPERTSDGIDIQERFSELIHTGALEAIWLKFFPSGCFHIIEAGSRYIDIKRILFYSSETACDDAKKPSEQTDGRDMQFIFPALNAQSFIAKERESEKPKPVLAQPALYNRKENSNHMKGNSYL